MIEALNTTPIELTGIRTPYGYQKKLHQTQTTTRRLKSSRCAAGWAQVDLRRRGSRLDIRTWPACRGQSCFENWATALSVEDHRRTEAERNLR